MVKEEEEQERDRVPLCGLGASDWKMNWTYNCRKVNWKTLKICAPFSVTSLPDHDRFLNGESADNYRSS